MLDKRLVIVSGKGGVGKSAVAAGLALLGQRNGLRILAVEMGSPGGLSTHFSTGPLEFKPREVRPGLHAMHIVRSEALLEYLSLQLRLPGVGRFGAVARAFDALATAAPAIREIITIGKILWEVKEDRWDLVVADAPPTGQIGSYLRAPRSISELVPTGRIRAQSEWMTATLADADMTQLAIVTLPEELPTTETLETMRWLEDEHIVPPPVVITNRALPELEDKSSPDGVVGEIANLHRSLWSEQQHWLAQVPPDLTLPYMFGLFTPGEVAAHMSDELETLT
ncbi:MAG: ArsA family ATPase [Acidobacteria bacterium]|nr:ArsA family ATPase [Acidobacteriota bacterium]MCH8971510.1 ArsA family ATPase [Acidobacteriota bacterium]MCZ6505242.1 anion-transporting ATPase [Actinomycetota bacterium]MCZ6566833.1 anion-transporting ATPase [Actinomycetota bacterium]MCZ6738364.1 anion-transporting ATPase [Actinomycetota bacterium]